MLRPLQNDPARALRQFLTALCLAGCSLGAAAAEPVQALRYGVTLFHYFQQDYFDALSELMIAQKTGELGVHTDNAELLRGGMSLSYGMDQQAQRIFTEFLDRPQPGVDRDRAWFYLAKIAWLSSMSRISCLLFSALYEFVRRVTNLVLTNGDIPIFKTTVSGLENPFAFK